MTDAIMWISLMINAIVFIGFAISFFLASKRTHNVEYRINSLGFFSFTGTVDKDKTTRFLKAKNRAILKENARIKSENNRISLFALIFMLMSIFAGAVKDEVTKKTKQTPRPVAGDPVPTGRAEG